MLRNLARPKLIYAYSPTSGPCRRLDGYLAQVLQRRHNHETFALYRVNVIERPDVAERLKVRDLPVLLVVDDLGRSRRLVRPKGPEDVRQFLAPWLR